MSYCEFCSNISNECVCPIDLIEPRLETELTIADNVMAAENPVIQRTHGLLDSFSRFEEIENIEEYKTPKSIIVTDELLCIPRLERKTNRLSEQDLNEIKINLFSEEEEQQQPIQLIPDVDLQEVEDIIINMEVCDGCHEFICICAIIQCTMPGCSNQYNLNDTDSSYEMCFQCEMKERKETLIYDINHPDDDYYDYDNY